MAIFNTSKEYGAVTKLLHWAIAFIFAFQYFAGYTMLSMQRGETVLGLNQNNYFNWHKSIGLIALGVVILRLLNRRFSGLPAWAPKLTDREKGLMHFYEKLLYLGMLVMPISGFIYVMAGGYGVHFAEAVHLPNPIGKNEALAFGAKWTHIVSAYLIAAALFLHLAVVFRHQFFVRDNLLGRMLPGGKKAG